MNIKIIIIIIVVAMLAGGGAVYFAVGPQSEQNPAEASKPIRQEYKRIPNDDGERF